MSKLKRCPIPCAVYAGGLAVSITGLLLVVSSMEYAPIMTGKLLFAALCLSGIAVCAFPLRHKRQRPKATAVSLRVRTHTNTPNRAA